MPASMTTNSLDAGPRLDVDDARDEHAGRRRRSTRPGSRTIGRPRRRARRRRARAAYSRGDRHRRAVVGDAEAAAEIEVLERDAGVAAARARSAASARGRARSGSSVVICEPTWTCTADELERRPRRAASRSSARASSSGTPNLLIFRPVEMCGWLFASMSGLTRSATRATRPCRARDRLDALELAGRLDVDRLEAERRPRARARRRDLPTPVNTICAGAKPAARATLDLPDRVGVGARCRARAAAARSRASSWPSARSGARADSRRTPRRSRGSAARMARRCRRRAACPRRAAMAASGTPSQTSVVVP